MPTPAVVRARAVALAAAVVLLLLGLGHLLLGLARRSVAVPAPTVDPTVVLACLLGAVVLGSWAVLGRARDAVTARTLRHHPGRTPVLSVADLQRSDHAEPCAWALPRAQAAWRASWRPLLPPLLAAVVCAALALATGVVTRMAADDLAARGVRTPAQVTATGWTWTGLGHSPWVRVTHVERGETLSSTVHGVDFVAVPVGTQLTVLVDPDDPGTVRSVDAPNVSLLTQWWESLLALALVLSLGWLAWLAARRLAWRRALRSTPWSRWEVLAGSESGGPVVLRSGAGQPVQAPTEVVARSRGGLPEGVVAVVAPRPGTVLLHRALLAAVVDPGAEAGAGAEAEGRGRLVELRLPSSLPERARWERGTRRAGQQAGPGAAVSVG